MSSTSRRNSSGRSSTSVIPARIMARCSSSDICRHSLAGTHCSSMASTIPEATRGVPGARRLRAVLLIAATALGDIERWWTRHGDRLAPSAQIGDLYRLLHQAAIEAQAAWSLLIDRGDGTRIFSIRAAVAPIALLLLERNGDIIVVDIRIPTQR